MIDLEQIEADREKASEDKADLFDFYHQNWKHLMAELRNFRQLVEDLNEAGITHRFS